MNTKTKIVSIATTILLSVSFAGPSQASPAQKEPTPVVATAEIPIAVPKATLKFDKVPVTTIPSPVETPLTPATTEVVVPAQEAPTAPVAAPEVPLATTTPVAPVSPSTAPTAPVTPTPVAVSGGNQGLLAAARSQIGQIQDCTAMVERALGTSEDLAPAQFFKFGTVVATPAPGDIIISAGHVGIYSGNGMMVSGGFNGNQTVEHPIGYVGAYSAVRVA